ncbi:MAG: hypothetical protein HYY31_05465 [Chloroflexi bacterium]|nr:hypothetical protein [Chloroflexota bacterium]
MATASIDDLASGKVAAGMGIVMGSPQTWRQAVQSDLDAVRGPVPVEAYNFALWPEGMPLNEALEALELFAREVAPGIKRTGPSAAPSGSVREEPT